MRESASRVPVEIVRVSDPNGTVRMAPQVPLEDLVRHPQTDIHEGMDALARRYASAIESARVILGEIAGARKKDRQVDPKLYWHLGDVLQRFIQEDEQSALFLNGIMAHFTRDLGISAVSWRKILRFRHLVPSEDAIDSSLDWKFYRDGPTNQILSAVTRASGRSQVAHVPSEAVLQKSKEKKPTEDQAVHFPAAVLHDLARGSGGKRNRIEVHLPRESLEKLKMLGSELAIPHAGPATVARALLIVFLDQRSRPETTLAETLRSARSLTESRRSQAATQLKASKGPRVRRNTR